MRRFRLLLPSLGVSSGHSNAWGIREGSMNINAKRLGYLSLLLAGLFLTASPLLPAAAAETPEALSVPIGSHKLLRLRANVGRIAIGDPKVADVNVVGARELLVLGKGQGVTSLLVWPRSSRKHASVEPVEYRVSVGGLAPGAPDEELKQVTIQPGSAIDGTVSNLFAHRRAEQAAAPIDKAGAADRSFVAVDTQVMSEVKIVEVTRTTAQRYGLNIFGYTGGSANALGTGNFTPGNLSSINLNSGTRGISSQSGSGYVPLTNAFNFIFGNKYFASVLSVLENKGLARTLAEPSLTAMSGQTATFLAGGEFPVPVPQSNGGGNGGATVTIQYKEFGVRLNLTPTVLSPTRIALKVAPEVSELDYTNGVNLNGYVIPGLIVRRTDTMVELGDGESFVLSGLVSNNMKANVDKVPFLGDIPILGTFFKSNSYQRDDKELIMVVTPHLVRPLTRNARLPQLPGAQIDGYRPNAAETIFLENGDFGQTDNGYSH